MLNFRNYTPKKAQYNFQEIAPGEYYPYLESVDPNGMIRNFMFENIRQ